MQDQDLWPDFGEIPKITSPKSILLEQVSFLEKKTSNILTGSIKSVNVATNRIANHFYIVAPLLKNYSYHLLTIYHGAMYYPCEMTCGDDGFTMQNEEELLKDLKEVFFTKKTISVISSLIGQSKEVSEF